LIKINFSMDFFLLVDFFWFFRELYILKFRDFFPDDFYDKKIDFLRKGGRNLESRVRRPGSLE